jgi:hypothetical protein
LSVPDANAAAVASRIERVALFVGPYRNLTTLSAAALALHPQIQVLNHAGERLLAQPELDFVASPDAETLRRFVAAGVEASAGGRRGDFGGSVTLSHAFDSETVRTAYAARYGTRALKDDARCFVWKESMRLQLRLMECPEGAGHLLERLPGVVLLAPFRHPLDVAVSSHATVHRSAAGGVNAQYRTMLTGNPDADLRETLEGVLDAQRWVLEQRDRWPERIFFFTQWELGEDLVRRWARFLGVSEDPQFLEDATRCLVVKGARAYAPEVLDYYRQRATAKLAPWPEVLRQAIG